MYHKVRFAADSQLDLRMAGKSRLERVMVQAGDVFEAEVRPYVEETEDVPVEMANLVLGDEGILLAVPMAWFRFIEEERDSST
jgi:hypothetical protein